MEPSFLERIKNKIILTGALLLAIAYLLIRRLTVKLGKAKADAAIGGLEGELTKVNEQTDSKKVDYEKALQNYRDILSKFPALAERLGIKPSNKQ